MRRFMLIAMVAIGGLLGIGLSAPAGATALGSEGKIVFVRANQIYTMTKAGGAVKQLTTTATGKNYRPKWSPDGKHIAYINETPAGTKDVWEMSATGTNRVRVTTGGTVVAAPVWSPDGAQLAFAQFGTTIFTEDCWLANVCPDEPPSPETGNFVYLVKATAPFGAPGLLRTVEDGLSAYFYASPISAYAGSSLSWSPDGSDLAIVNGDSDDSPDTGLHLTGLRPSPTSDVVGCGWS